jgi:hypothetical protein
MLSSLIQGMSTSVRIPTLQPRINTLVHLISEPGKGVATQNKEANETIDSSLESRKLRKQQHIHLELEDLTKLREFYQQKSSILSKVMQ